MENNGPSKSFTEIDISYRAQYGKLFSALLFQYGSVYINQIEDAIQNAFYKSLKSWKPDQIPENKENWFFIVARNDLINRIKKEAKTVDPSPIEQIAHVDEEAQEDLRLRTILLLAGVEHISSQTKVIFMLKNIFGLHIKEISACTLILDDAIYKSIQRAKKSFRLQIDHASFHSEYGGLKNLHIVEEILYAVFNIGFDSFNEKTDSVINDDLCLEAMALAKLLIKKLDADSTRNLMALFCFHIARIPARLTKNTFIPFFRQETTKWNTAFIELGFHYMTKPKRLSKYYLEAIVTSKHMTASKRDAIYWNEIIELYEMLSKLTDSPILIVNLCYCLHQVGRTKEAFNMLQYIEKQLPQDHLYYSLVKADILKTRDVRESNDIIYRMLNSVSQEIRKNHISENLIYSL